MNKIYEENKNEMENLAGMLFHETKPVDLWYERFPKRELPAEAKVTRFAPSPTGFLHIGGVATALINEAEAKRSGGVFILRLEDTDQSRLVSGAEESIYNGLAWAGISLNEGGKENKGEYGPYRQSQRLDIYCSFARELFLCGGAYTCFCSEDELKKVREEQERLKQPRRYSGVCRNLTIEQISKNIQADAPFVMRLRVPENEEISWKDLAKKNTIVWDSANIDDQVLLKSDGFPTYHLANVIDDHLMGVNRVYRGEEWISSTPKHLLLYKYFGWQPPEFAHLVLFRQFQTMEKLSKRKGEAGLEWYKSEGYLPDAVRNFLTRVIWAHPKDLNVYDHEEFVRGFDVQKMGDSAPQINLVLLDHINQEYLTRLTSGERFKKIVEWAREYDSGLAVVFEKYRDDASRFLAIEPEKMKKLSEARNIFGFYFEELYTIPSEEELLKETNGDMEKIRQAVLTYAGKFYDSGDAHDKWEDCVRKASAETGLKDKNMFMILRLVLTGSRYSPPLFEVMHALGEIETRRRLAVFQ